ncbi:toprim domain-containing protein, partial [Marinibactrum halimedae]|uniref:toprim domain-containing protein n=1 Tax=Marinibactrum halimedae TaxID=1444977 RepID=UPI0024E0978F
MILCEALLDAMTFWVHGYRNVTASYGTAGFTADHLTAFQHYGVERVLIAYDRDEAGDRAARALAEALQDAGLSCYRLLFPQGMDANQYALESDSPQKSLGGVIRNAQWWGEGSVQAEPQVETELPPLAAKAAIAESQDQPKPESEPAPELEERLPAQAQPEMAKPLNVTVDDDTRELTLICGPRSYRVRGLDKNKTPETLKVNVLARCEEHLHVDTFDLYAAKLRQAFIKSVAVEFMVEEN